jgi:CcmD family protein
MTTFFRVTAVMLVFMVQIAPLTAQQQPPRQQEEFTPIDQLPPQEQLPAAPLLIGAYAFVVLVLFGYMFMVARRLTTIQREVDRLDTDLRRTGKI